MPTRHQHIPLRSVELHILLSVVDRPRHGYAILQEAEGRTSGRPGFEIPTLYRALRRLRNAELIRTADPPEPDGDGRREYWVATALGRRALEAELTRLEAAVNLGRARIRQITARGGK
jgi:PadR family transcriptional regulator, regulatory protein PadR